MVFGVFEGGNDPADEGAALVEIGVFFILGLLDGFEAGLELGSDEVSHGLRDLK